MTRGFLSVFSINPNRIANPMIIVWFVVVLLGILILVAGIRIAIVVIRLHEDATGISGYLLGPIMALIGLGLTVLGGWLFWLAWTTPLNIS